MTELNSTSGPAPRGPSIVNLSPPVYEKHFLDFIVESGYRGLVAVHDCYKQDPGMVLVTQSIEEFAKRTGRKINKPIAGTSIAWFEPLS